MLPSQLRVADFAAYPLEARALAAKNLQLFQKLPLAYLLIFFRELSSYDWKMPAERNQITSQIDYLSNQSNMPAAKAMTGFASLKLDPQLEHGDWVSHPSLSLERFTAWLWSSQQMDSFRATAESFANEIAEAIPGRVPAAARLVVVVIGQGTERADIPVFRKLWPHGVRFTNVDPRGGLKILLAEAARRACIHSSEAFLHWYIDGGTSAHFPDAPEHDTPEHDAHEHDAPGHDAHEHGDAPAGLTQISYDGLEAARTALLKQTQKAIESGSTGPEGLRTMLAQMTPADVGLGGFPNHSSTEQPASNAEVLDHFQLSLLTEGSGTQIFSTTFVQWAARECLRRAQPETLLVRYAPRQQMQTMNAMLSGARIVAADAAGSLVDADMGAYYTWLNLRRLPGAGQARFLAWYEGQGEAVAIGPGLARGTTSNSAIDLHRVLALLK